MRLKEIREKKRISQTVLANTIGVQTRTIAYWEGGQREPGHKTIIKLADYFGVTLDYLLERVPNVDACVGDEEQLIGKFRTLTEEQRKDVLSYVDFIKTK